MPEAPRRAAPGGLIRTRVLRRLMLAVAVGSLLLAIPPATSAAGSVTLSTPYPAVAVPPGEKVSFKINVQTDVSDRVDLSVADVPDGWIASLRGEGFVVDGVQTTGDDPVELTLDVTVPEGAAAGTGRVVVNARSGAARDSLALDIRVEEGAAGEVTLVERLPDHRRRRRRHLHLQRPPHQRHRRGPDVLAVGPPGRSAGTPRHGRAGRPRRPAPTSPRVGIPPST